MTTLRSLAPLLVCFFLGAPGRGVEPKANAAHAKAGVTCFDCHREERPTKAAVADDSCMACHGDPPAMAAYTKALPVNPHAVPKGDHPGLPLCTQCHCQHKQPVVKCLECHPKFKLAPR